MARGITIEVDKRDLRRLNKAVEEYARVRKIDNADAANRIAFDVALRAMGSTKKASQREIDSKLKTNIQTRTLSKTGKTLKRPKTTYLPSALARSVFIGRLRKGTLFYKGLPKGPKDPQDLSAGDFTKFLKAYVSRRASSAAFIASGFLMAAKRISRFVKKKKGALRLEKRIWGKGSAVAARPGVRSFATLINAATSQEPSSVAALKRYGEAGANSAIRAERADSVRYIKEQLAKQAKKFNRK